MARTAAHRRVVRSRRYVVRHRRRHHARAQPRDRGVRLGADRGGRRAAPGRARFADAAAPCRASPGARRRRGDVRGDARALLPPLRGARGKRGMRGDAVRRRGRGPRSAARGGPQDRGGHEQAPPLRRCARAAARPFRVHRFDRRRRYLRAPQARPRASVVCMHGAERAGGGGLDGRRFDERRRGRARRRDPGHLRAVRLQRGP